MAARGVMAKPFSVRPMPQGLALARVGGIAPRASFQLFDSRKRFGAERPRSAGLKTGPHVFVFGESPFVPLFQPQQSRSSQAQPDDGMVGAERLGRRLKAIKLALENLPRQAKRLARWQARRDRMASPKFRSPLRPGLAPGHRREPGHEVDAVLRECHALASDARGEDSS
jgi:hypothetical protein